jgi:predicted  nucleic acid-binding Zn-ribbon protein
MGWLLAFVFAAICGLLAVFLFVQWDEKRQAVAKLQASAERLQFLEKQDADLNAMRTERDALARGLLALREAAGELEHVRRERARIDADAKAFVDRFNGQVAEAKVKMNERRQRLDAEAKAFIAKFNEQMAEAKAQADERQRRLDGEARHLEVEITALKQERDRLADEVNLRHMGFYEARYDLTTSLAYKASLDDNLAKQQAMIKAKQAAACRADWPSTVAGATGRRQADKLLSLMLRAFNGDCDAAISRVRPNNFQSIEARINRAFGAINKLGEPQACALAGEFLQLKMDELVLTHEHALKVQAEREEQRELRERMREEAIVAKEQEKADREAAEAAEQERLIQEALDAARAEMEAAAGERQAELEAKMRELEQQVAEAHAQTERAISEAQRTRVGYVYVISNIGAFGENIYKIGMTRRKDPEDRVWELSGAAVPFDFDIHALIRTDDAPALEAELHRRFAHRRVNIVNERKEFFHVSMDEIAEVVRERCGDIELTLVAEAAEFFQSEAYRRSKGLPLLCERQMAASLLESL